MSGRVMQDRTGLVTYCHWQGKGIVNAFSKECAGSVYSGIFGFYLGFLNLIQY